MPIAAQDLTRMLLAVLGANDIRLEIEVGTGIYTTPRKAGYA